MKNYTRENLKSDEVVVLETHPSKWIYLGVIIAAVPVALFNLIGIFSGEYMVALVPSLLWLIFFLRAFIVRNCTEYTVTDRRVIRKRGWLRVDIEEIQRAKVEGVNMEQGIIERIITRTGSIVFTGTGGRKFGFYDVANPKQVRNLITE